MAARRARADPRDARRCSTVPARCSRPTRSSRSPSRASAGRSRPSRSGPRAVYAPRSRAPTLPLVGRDDELGRVAPRHRRADVRARVASIEIVGDPGVGQDPVPQRDRAPRRAGIPVRTRSAGCTRPRRRTSRSGSCSKRSSASRGGSRTKRRRARAGRRRWPRRSCGRGFRSSASRSGSRSPTPRRSRSSTSRSASSGSRTRSIELLAALAQRADDPLLRGHALDGRRLGRPRARARARAAAISRGSSVLTRRPSRRPGSCSTRPTVVDGVVPRTARCRGRDRLARRGRDDVGARCRNTSRTSWSTAPTATRCSCSSCSARCREGGDISSLPEHGRGS